MRVLLTGGTGFVGGPVAKALRAAGHDVTIVSRQPGFVPAKAIPWGRIREGVADSDAIVNLAGESVADGRWTAARKAEILASRVEATRAIVDAMAAASTRPKVLVNASATGFYGDRGDEELDETAAPGTDFLAGVCQAWEAEALRAQALDVRVAMLRIGVVLGGDGGALGRMIIPFRLGLGGVLGSGRQWMSWVHRDDVVGIVMAALENAACSGPINVTSPVPVRNRDFTKAMARAVSRPAIFPVPGFALRLAVGEMADLLLGSQRVLPVAAEAAGYRFKYPGIAGALAAALD
jgi:hypothetical protein